MRNNETRTIKVTAYCVCILAIGELALILLSWILSSTFPYSHIKSMLNGEGIRWFSEVSQAISTRISLYG